MLRCLFEALRVVMRFFGASWVLSMHEIPHPNQCVESTDKCKIRLFF